MKAIKDCKWIVKTGGWWWASTVDYNGLGQNLIGEHSFNRNEATKRNWEKFAKLNKIRKWKYI